MAPTLGTILNFIHSQLFVTVPKPTTSYAGRVVIVTGGNVGLGLETARSIALLDASKVIITSRSTSAGEAARASILASLPPSRDPSSVEAWPLDLCSHASIRAFAARASADLPRLDALVCNAGVATGRFAPAPDMGGHETTIATNVVGTFLLALLVLPALKRTAARTNSLAHLVIVSSEVHFFTDFAERKNVDEKEGIFAMLRDATKSDMPDRYNVSKLLEVLVVRELAASPSLMGRSPYPVVVTAPNPGLCASALRREMYEGNFAMRWGVWLMERLLERSSEEGARNFVACASAGEAYHGRYVSDGVPKEPAALVRSEEGAVLQKRVWEELRDILEGIEPGVTRNF
ncbi:putative short-chain dehydrogenase reductase [Diplodia seriata]|uniref:Putative short-chain dehydrogenase reductase n=1 Tax=Diplodia seriata TaxID=420778 RepID=A0A0G2DX76_9PEZI|nr:putative short-chain dehydrogenase reductase [Diplodia seriata]